MRAERDCAISNLWLYVVVLVVIRIQCLICMHVRGTAFRLWALVHYHSAGYT